MVKVTAGQQGGLEEAPLSREERKLFVVEEDNKQVPGPVFNRGLEDTRTEGSGELLDKIYEYRQEIMKAAQVAKSQFGKDFAGQTSDSDNNFVIDRIWSGYFGFDGWDDLTDYTQGVNNWIDQSNPTNLSGAGGTALTVGDAVVHLVLGIGTYHTSPVNTRVRFTLNDIPKTSISLEEEFRETDMQIKWLDAPILLQENDDVLAETWVPSSGSDELYLEGITFVENKFARELDPANVTNDSTNDVSGAAVTQ